MPVQTVFDLTFHPSSRTLFAVTHGRSQWKLDLTILPLAVGPPPAPLRLALSAPVPNPSRGPAKLTLELPRATRVEVAVYDVVGRRVRVLLEGPMEPGRHDLAWDGRDARGGRAARGVYFVSARAPSEVVTRRLVRVE
jgi:hypothetical protein